MQLTGQHFTPAEHMTDARVELDIVAGDHVTVNISVTATSPVTGGTVRVALPLRVEQMIEQGFQSWSTVRRTTPSDIRPVRSEAPRWFTGQMLANRELAGRVLTGDGYLIFDEGAVGFLRADTTFGTVVVQPDGAIELWWLLDDLHLDTGEHLKLDPVVIIHDEPGRAYDTYARLSGEAAGARPFRRSARVWCSWYQYFGAITPSIIRENLALAAAHDIEVVQIDDGWQAEIGVWGRPNATWGEAMSVIARDIKAAGCVPGIWTAPFLAIEGGTVATEHPDWLVRNEAGQPTTALFHGGWGGKIYALDTTNPEVIDHMVATYQTLRRQGFEYFKIDFLHAASAVGARLRGHSMSRAQALRAGLAAVRHGIGDDAYLVGCGSPLLSAVGYVDAMRVSEDVAPFFAPRTYFPGFLENTVAARNAIEASVLRAPLHQRWFTVDPDCVLLRPSDTELSAQEREVVADAALAASGFIALSDDLARYDDATWAQAAQLYQDAVDNEGARFLVDPFATPLVVQTGRETISIGWEQPHSARRPR